ncbi:MAG: hypothetical protein AB4426_24890 [Xenococcaceae cyanobacterium]
MDNNERASKKLRKQKKIARAKLNDLPPQQAQKIVNDVLFADKWKPDIEDFNWSSSLWNSEDEETESY